MQKYFVRSLTPSAVSVFSWGIYLCLTGFALIITPHVVLPWMGYPATIDVWVRITGLLTSVLGFYYIQAARHEIVAFFHWKIWGHAIGILVMLWLYFTNIAPSPILLTALIDLGAAMWTLYTLRSQKSPAS